MSLLKHLGQQPLSFQHKEQSCSIAGLQCGHLMPESVPMGKLQGRKRSHQNAHLVLYA